MKHTPFNVINTPDIEEYLKTFANGNERLHQYLCIALVRVLKKHPDAIENVSELPSQAPEWLRLKWDAQREWHRFNPRKTNRIAGKIHHTALWLEMAIQHDLEWLHNRDEQERPRKLLKLTSFEQIYQEADVDRQRITEQERAKNKAALSSEIEGEDYITMMTFDDGYRFVRLLNERALKRESAYMEHCVGNHIFYEESLKNTSECIYSLRTPDNTPCLTLAADRYYVAEMAAMRNAPPKQSLLRYAGAFAFEMKLDMAWCLGLREGYKKTEHWDAHASSQIVPPRDEARQVI